MGDKEVLTRTASMSSNSVSGGKKTGLLSTFRRALSMKSTPMGEHVDSFLDPEATPDQQKKALYGIRLLVEKNKSSQEVISTGAIPVLVLALQEKKNTDFPLWSLWVLRFCAETSDTATGLILQEPMMIESLIGLVNGAYVGSEQAKRSVETMQHLSSHEMTLSLMGREDLFKCLTSALIAAPPEATASLLTLINISEVNSGAVPSYLPQLASDRTLTNLDRFAKAVPDKQELVDKLKAHLAKVAPAKEPALKEEEEEGA
ncbi:hypothetical protein BASA81_008260 [Batrachochytrium salamandrivorans]|nr:hypothetical protein BASA81_008260 [Batrachochytrium salamandrivorans]